MAPEDGHFRAREAAASWLEGPAASSARGPMQAPPDPRPGCLPRPPLGPGTASAQATASLAAARTGPPRRSRAARPLPARPLPGAGHPPAHAPPAPGSRPPGFPALPGRTHPPWLSSSGPVLRDFPKKESSFFRDGAAGQDLGTDSDFCGEVAMAAEQAAAGPVRTRSWRWADAAGAAGLVRLSNGSGIGPSIQRQLTLLFLPSLSLAALRPARAERSGPAPPLLGAGGCPDLRLAGRESHHKPLWRAPAWGLGTWRPLFPGSALGTSSLRPRVQWC